MLLEYKGWFNNFDRNTSNEHHNFVRTEHNHGRKEWVVMEHEGAGAITRLWVPWRNQLRPETKIIIRFYFDGADEPTIEGNMFELFQGKGMVPFPLAHESLRSAVSFFPIPYAKSCKVTMSDHPFFFQFTYREYEEGTAVDTFSMEAFEAAKATIDATCQLLGEPKDFAGGDQVQFSAKLAGGQMLGEHARSGQCRYHPDFRRRHPPLEPAQFRGDPLTFPPEWSPASWRGHGRHQSR